MIKELVILSGKGGTGKTSITAAFASLAQDMVICDADVDAADLHLLVTPRIQCTTEFIGGSEAVHKPDLCSGCGLCRELCRFEAVRDDFSIDPIACEGCGVCVDLCPEQAIDFPRTVCGQWYRSDTRFGPMIHARLGIAQENSGKLVATVREEAKKLAEKNGHELILTDGPPGVGCPVIASMGQATAILIIAEPTVSGLHDMQRLVELCRHFKIPAAVCINKYDLNLEQTVNIETFALENKVDIAGKIAFDPIFTRSMIDAQTVFETDNTSQAANEIRQVWETVLSLKAFDSSAKPINHIQEFK